MDQICSWPISDQKERTVYSVERTVYSVYSELVKSGKYVEEAEAVVNNAAPKPNYDTHEFLELCIGLVKLKKCINTAKKAVKINGNVYVNSSRNTLADVLKNLSAANNCNIEEQTYSGPQKVDR